jgi:hypothetical protein
MHTKDTPQVQAEQPPIPLIHDVSNGPCEERSKLDPHPDVRIAADPIGTFFELFSGRVLAYGVSRGSLATTETKTLTSEEYRRHLENGGGDDSWSLGLNPLCEDNTVRFAALDLDGKDLPEDEVQRTLATCEEQAFPLVWTRSRSGGLHGWMFLAEPVAAEVVRRALTHTGMALGWRPRETGDSKAAGDRFFEVFPRHDWLPADGRGNWIRLPWPGGEQAERRRGVWSLEGEPSFVEWLTYAMQRRARADYICQLAEVATPLPSCGSAETASGEGAEMRVCAARGARSAPGAAVGYCRRAQGIPGGGEVPGGRGHG